MNHLKKLPSLNSFCETKNALSVIKRGTAQQMRVLNGIDATFAVFTLNVCIPTTMMMAMPRRKSKYGKRFCFVIVNKKDSRYDRGQGHHIWFMVKGSWLKAEGHKWQLTINN